LSLWTSNCGDVFFEQLVEIGCILCWRGLCLYRSLKLGKSRLVFFRGVLQTELVRPLVSVYTAAESSLRLQESSFL
jgi:hypothetical protein